MLVHYVPAQPTSVVYLRPDTIGDLVIFQPALARLLEAWPEARHTIVVRPGYETLAPLFPASVHWLVAALNPFTQRPSECRAELAALHRSLAGLHPDLILASAPSRTWLEAAVAAHFAKVRSVALGDRPVSPLFAAALRLDLGVDAATAFGETVPVDDGERDWENQHRLADRLLGRKGARTAPSVAVPAAAAERARGVLAAKKLPAGGWAAVFPAGLANVQVKSWPPERFGELTAWLQEERKLPALLLGHESEAEILEAAAAAAARGRRRKPELWLGRDGEVPVLAALLRESRLYVGHDTGAMHLAAAVGRPAVGIFGGGHWPRFRPVGRQTVSVVQPLPCFGCNWDCHFGDGPCVKTIDVADVRAGVERALAAGDEPVDATVEVRRLSDDARRLAAGAAPRYAALQRDRLERQHKIEELKREADAKDAEIASLKREADAKDAEIAELKRETDAKDAEIAELKRETDAKDVEIAELKRAAEERKREMEAIKAELEAECAEKDREIAGLKARANETDAEIERLKAVCNEREALIFQQAGHIVNFQKIVADLNAAHAEKDRELAGRAARLAEVEGILAKLPPDAATWASAFSAKDVHIRNIEALLAHREREGAEKDRSLANYAAGHHGLEQAKHYGRLLAEKERVIQELHRACVEREAVIRQLAAEAAGPFGRLRQLALGASAYLREKWWRPADDWLFRKVVEDYWMQIGILRQYDPRPIAWDRRMPKRARAPAGRLPRIGLVTPSYGQPAFIESTMVSVLNQNYPGLLYVVQDGGSPDASPQIIARYADRLRHWESARDRGQADAIRRGFAHLEAELRPDDVMAWLNSDDLLAPRALATVAEYFARHPRTDVIYSHRIIIDETDREIGRWIMPRHNPADLEWIDYVPQETLFWRKRAWDLAGGIDPTFHFALDWDLLARFERAGCRIARLPCFLGCFRLHRDQKTSQVIHTTGAEEMARIRTRFHAEKADNPATIAAVARRIRFRGALSARLLALGLRF